MDVHRIFNRNTISEMQVRVGCLNKKEKIIFLSDRNGNKLNIPKEIYFVDRDNDTLMFTDNALIVDRGKPIQVFYNNCKCFEFVA